MDALIEYFSIGARDSEHSLFDEINVITELRVAVKVYLILVHLFCLILLLLVIKLKNKGRVFKAKEKTLSVKSMLVSNGDVTLETCDWVNSTFEWFFRHSLTHRTPALIKFWIKALNRKLCKDQKMGLKVAIDDLCPGCSPPNLMNVFCVRNSGNLQFITFQVESKELGFFVTASQSTSKGHSVAKLKLNIELKGEVSLKMNARPKSLQTGVSFVGNPEIHISTTVLQKDGSEPPSVETIEEKVKDVICKTVTNIQLQKDESVKEKPLSPSVESCLGCKGKLLIKVIKATELQGNVKNAPISPYCVIYSDHPAQRKRTSMLKGDKNPFWNEYLAFDVTPTTKEITFDLYDYDKTSPELNCHLDETEPAMEKDDFLGQVVVPLATVNSSQTCRMTMPVLPKSYRSEYAHGQLSLEFTFDKDGKVMDSAIPLIAEQAKFVEQTIGVSQTQIENSQKASGSSAGDATEVTVNGYQETSLNGYVMGTSGYLETSLDDLAHEIELYEAEDFQQSEKQESEDHEKAAESINAVEEQREEPDAGGAHSGGLEAGVVTVEVTEEAKVIEEQKPEQEKEQEPAEGKDLDEEKEKEEEFLKEELESGGKTKKKFKLGSSLRRRKKEKHEEDKKMEQPRTPESEKGGEEQETEPKQNKKWFKRGHSSKTKQEAPGQETEVTVQAEPDIEVKSSRWSFRKKSSKSSKKASPKKETEQVAESVTSEQPLDIQGSDITRTEESAEQSDGMDRTEEEVKEREPAEQTPQEKPVEEEMPLKEVEADIVVDTSPSQTSAEPAPQGTNESKENSDTLAEFKKQPKKRELFKFRGRRSHGRPASVAIPDTALEQSKDKPLERENPARHSFHGGDLDHSDLQRRDSEMSQLSYSPSQFSTLMIEVTENGVAKYYFIPRASENRKYYDVRGTKFRVYNDHTFADTSFSESLKCDVCDNAISGILSKRGYECTDCKMRVHKKCHSQTSVMCASSTLKDKNPKPLPVIRGHHSEGRTL